MVLQILQDYASSSSLQNYAAYLLLKDLESFKQLQKN